MERYHSRMSKDTTGTMMTVAELASLVQLSQSTIRRLAAAGDIPATRIGGSWRFDRAKVADHLEKSTNE